MSIQESVHAQLRAVLTVDLVRQGARRHRDRIALNYRGASMTFAEVDRASNRLANTLIAHGVAPGDRIALLLDSSLHSISIDFACLKARAVRVPLNTRLSPAEHGRMLAETGAGLLIAAPALSERAEALAAASALDLKTFTLGASASGIPDLLGACERASDRDPRLPTSPDDVVLALFTSGTTGTLKAAQHTQASYAAICANVLCNLVSPGRDDAMIHAASLIHASGTFVLPFWLRGGRSIILDGFDPNAYLDEVAASGATHANLVPTMLGMLLQQERNPDLSRLSSIIYGASPMPRPVIEAAMDRWGPIFTQYYGQTEAPLAITVLDAADHVGPDAPLGACGQPSIDMTVRLLDEAGAEVRQGEIGEIAVAGPMVHAGYWNAPALDAEARTVDGLLRTRDLGRFDERGFLHLIDRTSDMIVTGGYNVYPREVEDVLMAHPAIVECAVVGAPDPHWVEAVTAFVVVRQGETVDDAVLIEWMRVRLAGYKIPKRIKRVDAIPKSAVGKILRRALRAPLWADART